MNRMPSCFAVVLVVAAFSMSTLGQVTAPGATPKLVGEGYRFTEGPAADENGDVYFSDIPNMRIYKWKHSGDLDASGAPTLFIENSGGTNGLYFDGDKNLIGCAGDEGRLVSVAPDKTVTPVIETYRSKRYNKPNDLWINPQGGIYFTDPAYGNFEITQGGEHVYYLAPNRASVIRVISDFTRPNGLIGTPDGGVLYVADAGAKKIYRYVVRLDGSLADKKLFADRGSDGMTIDNRGNVYLTSDGAVWVYSPAGEVVQTIAIPKRPSNVTFGGPSFQTLFITARDSVYTLAMKARGVRYP